MPLLDSLIVVCPTAATSESFVELGRVELSQAQTAHLMAKAEEAYWVHYPEPSAIS